MQIAFPVREPANPDQTGWPDLVDSTRNLVKGEAFADCPVPFGLPDDECQVTCRGAVPGIPGSAQGCLFICPAVGIIDDGKIVFPCKGTCGLAGR